MPEMQRTLAAFVRALRDNEVHISPAEVIDAHAAAAAVGYADRGLLRDALCVTLAKSQGEVAIFDECFDTFFDRRRIVVEPPEAVEIPESSEAPILVRQVLAGDEVALDQAMENAAARVGVGQIRISTQRNLLVRKLLDEMGLRDLESMIHALRATGRIEDQIRADQLSLARRQLFGRVGVFLGREIKLHTDGAARKLREALVAEQNFINVAPEDFQAMEAIVRRMAKRLATRYSRKRREAKRGRLDVRSTVRRSMVHGGIPLDVVWKTLIVDKPKIVVICDVSRSVAAAAQLLLLFLYALGEVVEKLDAYAFSDRLVCVNDVIAKEPVDRAIANILTSIGFRPTDYGRALADFRELNGHHLDKRTTVIILGDGRSNSSDPRLDLMREIADRARTVIWLNPEPETFWDQGDSEMHAYRRFCTVAKTCNTLKGLERIIEDVLRTYQRK